MQKVYIEDYDLMEGSFVDGNKTYPVRDLIKAAENLPEFDLPLIGINLRHTLCQDNLKSFLYHYKRVEKADLNYPIIIDDTGYICDGWHRVAKAILLGHTTIKAKRLNLMPQPE